MFAIEFGARSSKTRLDAWSYMAPSRLAMREKGNQFFIIEHHILSVNIVWSHKDYESMKPYIEIASDTQRIELDKWNGVDAKYSIIEMLEKFDAAQLKQAYELIKTLA